MDHRSCFRQEWQTLQANHEQHERNALAIKLVCVGLVVSGLAAEIGPIWLAVLVILLWLQEGIVKTYQARIGDRLLIVEAQLQLAEPALAAMQLHTTWAASRPGTAGLITGYLLSACRPTVAFPYLPMLLAGVIHTFCSA
jgi:hypothetical protein